MPRLAPFAVALVLAAIASAGPVAAQAPAGPRVASAKAYAHYLRAKQAELRSDWKGALEELQSAVAFDSASASLRVALAEAYARAGHLSRAEVDARRALEADPTGPAGAEAHLLLGKVAVLRHKGADAAKELAESVRLQSELARGKAPDEAALDPEAWRMLAQVEIEAGDEAAAARTLEDLAARLPSEGAASLRDMGRVYLERHDLDRAETYLRKAVERDSRDVDAWRRLAELAEARHRPDDERKAWESLLREEPEDGDALLALGRLALKSGDAASARAWFGQLLLVSRDEAGARVSTAFAWLEVHQPADALRTLQEGVASTGGDPRVYYGIGLALQDLRKWPESAEAFAAVAGEEGDVVSSARASQAFSLVHAGRNADALTVLEPVLKARPHEVRLLSARAYVLERSGRAAEAVLMLEKEVRDRAQDGGAPDELYEALAGSLQAAGRAADAVRMLRSAVAQRSRDEALCYALGVAQDKAGDREAAIGTMQGLLAINPEHADAMNFVGYSWAERGIRLEEAERLLSRALEIKPDNASFLDSLGWIQYQKGDYARAVGLLEHADALSGSEPTILEHLGDAYGSARRPADAAKAYRRALEAFDDGAEPEEPDQRGTIERKLRELPGSDVRPARR